MGKIWVLDTETKGTGAQVVPLDKAQRRPGKGEPLYVPPERTPKPPKEPEPRPPRRFRVVDVMSSDVLAESLGTRATVELLEGLDSIVDVRIYVWRRETGAWRLLTLREQRLLWALRGEPDTDAGERAAPGPAA